MNAFVIETNDFISILVTRQTINILFQLLELALGRKNRKDQFHQILSVRSYFSHKQGNIPQEKKKTLKWRSNCFDAEIFHFRWM